MTKPFPDAALTDICRQLLDEWNLSPEQIKNLAASIPAEAEAMREERDEAAWMEHQQALMESGGPDRSAYRRDVIEAGRGHLLGEA